jgi:hypothetical protein
VLACRKSPCHVLTATRAQPHCRASLPPNRFPSPIVLEGMTNRGLRRRRWTRSSKCAARSRGDLINILDGTAVISPAAAKGFIHPVSPSFLDRWPLSQCSASSLAADQPFAESCSCASNARISESEFNARHVRAPEGRYALAFRITPRQIHSILTACQRDDRLLGRPSNHSASSDAFFFSSARRDTKLVDLCRQRETS